jgi:hydrogenase maturation protease
MTEARILVAGIGNIFLGDDAFGVEVAQRLARRPLAEDVSVVDFGIRGFDLAHALVADEGPAILIDATPRGGTPGSLYVIEPELDEVDLADDPEQALDSHGMDPVRVLRLARAMGGQPRRVLVVGCEPAAYELDEAGGMGLSPPVAAAVDSAIELIERLIDDLRREGGTGDAGQTAAEQSTKRAESRRSA